MAAFDYDALAGYTSAVAAARKLYSIGALTAAEYKQFERKMMVKYSVDEKSIYRLIRLDNIEVKS